MKKSLKDTDIQAVQTDVGPIVDSKSNRLDPNLTFESFSRWIQGGKEWIAREMVALGSDRSPDLIVTDISPMALKLARKIGCPCITVANFSWIDLLKPLPYHKEKEGILSWLSECFAVPDLVIKLPFSMKMDGFRSSRIRVASLLYRKPTLSVEETKMQLGGEINKPLIVVSLGCHLPLHLDFDTNEAQVVMLSPVPIKMNERILPIVGHPESQNIIQAADFVIAKAGYSTLAECTAFRCPIDLIPREGYPEDAILVKEASMLGIGSRVPLRRSNHNHIKIPTMEEIEERRKGIQNSHINELQSRQSAPKLILDLL